MSTDNASASPRWRVIDVPTVGDDRGRLSVLEESGVAPFAIKRVFYVHGMPAGAERGGHAHRQLEELIVCITGRLEVQVDDGSTVSTVVLDTPARAFYLPPLHWAVQRTLAPGTTYFVLASHEYSAPDYIRDYAEFARIRQQ